MKPLDEQLQALEVRRRAGELSDDAFESERTRLLVQWAHPDLPDRGPAPDEKQQAQPSGIMGVSRTVGARILAVVLGFVATMATAGIIAIAKEMLTLGAEPVTGPAAQAATGIEFVIMIYIWYRISRTYYQSLRTILDDRTDDAQQDRMDVIEAHVQRPDNPRLRNAVIVGLVFAWIALMNQG
tara:strand:+ start:670 stop:1218 length:549 start_codon:yes stop_codon:yes gene_type:complete